MHTVSIIIPIYNIAEYVSLCVDSVLLQTYKEIEIILVDDGSTDASSEICDNYAALDERIRVIHRNNGGLSAARNSGIDIASGEYIYFVDGDDLIHPECIERLLESAVRNNADISSCSTNSFLEEKKIDYSVVGKGETICTGREMCQRLMLGQDSCGVIAWNKLYKRYLFDDIRYPEGMVYEDVATTHRLLFKAEKVVFLKDELAFYRSKRTGSITHSGNKKYRDAIKASRMVIAFFEENNESGMADQGMYYLCNNYARMIHEKVNPSDVPNLKREQKELYCRIKRSNLSGKKKTLSFIATYLPILWLLADSAKRTFNIIREWKGNSLKILLDSNNG